MEQSLIDKLSYKYKKVFKIDPLMQKEEEFKEELNFFLQKSGKDLSRYGNDEVEFLLKIGSAIYSDNIFGFSEDFLTKGFWEDWGQYMNDGQGYVMPENPLGLARKLKDMGVIKIRDHNEVKAILLTEEFLRMRECKFWGKEYIPKGKK